MKPSEEDFEKYQSIRGDGGWWVRKFTRLDPAPGSNYYIYKQLDRWDWEETRT